MNIYDTANKLAKEIKEAKEYREYKKLKEEIKLDSNKKIKVEEFEHLRYEIQLKTIKGEESQLEESKQLLQEKYKELLEDEKIKKYFEAEVKFDVMVADINKIIAEAVKDVL